MSLRGPFLHRSPVAARAKKSPLKRRKAHAPDRTFHVGHSVRFHVGQKQEEAFLRTLLPEETARLRFAGLRLLISIAFLGVALQALRASLPPSLSSDSPRRCKAWRADSASHASSSDISFAASMTASMTSGFWSVSFRTDSLSFSSNLMCLSLSYEKGGKFNHEDTIYLGTMLP